MLLTALFPLVNVANARVSEHGQTHFSYSCLFLRKHAFSMGSLPSHRNRVPYDCEGATLPPPCLCVIKSDAQRSNARKLLTCTSSAIALRLQSTGLTHLPSCPELGTTIFFIVKQKPKPGQRAFIRGNAVLAASRTCASKRARANARSCASTAARSSLLSAYPARPASTP